MRPKPLIGYRALQARSQIDSLLAGTGWFLTVETRVRDWIEPDPEESVRDDLALTFKRGRFDFVIASTEQALPRLVIELDGPTHDEPIRLAADGRKDELCLLAGLPIVRLALAHLEIQDQATALEWIVAEFVRFQEQYPAVRREWAVGRDDVREGLIDTLAESDWIANRRRRFPAIDRVVERLADRFSIFENDLPRTSAPTDAPLVVETWPDLRSPTVTSRVTRRGGETIYETSRQIPMSRRTADLLEMDLLEPKTGREHLDVFLEFACFHALGWHRDEIDQQVATWFALREVERWANRALATAME